MLSIENISDPSCSSRAPPLKADERASSGQLPFHEADPVVLVKTQTSNFCLRDYAFAYRTKGIETNWPFPQRFLQLCLKHGIEELLPSFEPPDLVRSQCWKKPLDLEAQHIVPRFSSLEIKDAVSNGFAPKSCLPSEEIVLEADQYPSQKEGKQEFARPLPMPKKLEISRDLLGKKCKLVLKLSAGSQSTRRTEDVASTPSIISDPMASKVCPVCKLFSSTSNTTLNAHMDQCLFMESNTNTEEIKISNLKTKPSKKRRMVEIYATAPYCTLEDLDRRNGTTWARDLALALAAPASKAPTEIKRPRLPPVDIRCDGGDEAVYVDSNGIKIRILSPMMPREESAKEISEGNDVMFSKSKQFGRSYLKPLCKKLSSFEMPRDESEASSVANYHIGTLKEKEEAHSAVDEHNQNRHSGSAALRQWVCSKRSDLPKKMKKSIHQFSKNPDVRGNSVVRSHSLDPSGSTKDLPSSPRIKTSDLQTRNNEKAESSNPHVHKVKWSSGSTLSNGSRLKLSRSCTSSSSYLSSMQKSDTAYQDTARPSESCQRSMKAKKLVSLKNILVRRPYFPFEAGNGDVVEKSPKMFRKKRSILVTSKRGGELSSDGNGACEEVRTLRSNYSMSALSSVAKRYVEQMSPKGKNTRVPSDAECHVTAPTPNAENKVVDDHVSGIKTHEEPTKARLFDITRQDVAFPTNIQVADEMDLRGKEDPQAVQFRESRAETLSAQESSACLTSHGDPGLEVRPDNSSVTSSQIKFNENQSPGSTASTISTPSRRPESFGGAQGRERRDIRGEHLLDSQSCCCPRKEGLSGEFPFPMAPSKGKQISSVSCSSARIESPIKSNLTKLFVDPAASFPTGLGSNGTPSTTPQTPSTPNSVLRLMGKNLMVLKEGSTQHSDAQSTPSLGFVPTQESFQYDCNYQSHPKKTSHFLPYQKQAVTSRRNPYNTKEVIVIDDSPETGRVSTMPVNAGSNTVAQQRPFSCFPISHSQYIPMDVSGGFRLVFPKPGPRPEGFRPLLPSPLFYQPVFYP